MRRLFALPAALCAALTLAAPAPASPVLVYDGGQVRRADDPALPGTREANPIPTDARRCDAVQAGAATPPTAQAAAISVRRALRRAYDRGDIDRTAYTGYSDVYAQAKAAWRRLGGTRRSELGSALGTVNRFAARGLLSASRMAPVFLELERNTEWWTGRATPPPSPPPSEGGDTPRAPGPCTSAARIAAGPRIQFKGDPLTLQYYPGAGLRLQPLANFGKANALYNACKGINTRKGTPCRPDELRSLLDRLVAMAANRNGFLAWEYYFPIYGGRPPWVSGIAEGTALSALSRGAALFREMQQPPPPDQAQTQPVSAPTGGAVPPPPAGRPSDTQRQPAAQNPPEFYLDAAKRSLAIFQTPPPAGVRVAGHVGPHYLIYSFSPGERVGNAFLQSLVGLWDFATVTGDRTARALFDKADLEARWELQRLDTGAWSLYELGGAESDLNYHRTIRDFLRNLCDRTQTAVYCQAAERFTGYLTQNPQVAVVGPHTARAGRATRVSIRVSKISCLTISVLKGGKVVYMPTWYFPHGIHSFSYTPRTAGAYRIEVLARDLLNHQARAEARLEVLKPKKIRKKPAKT